MKIPKIHHHQHETWHFAGAPRVVSNASGNCFAFSRKVTAAVTLKPDAAVAVQILEL